MFVGTSVFLFLRDAAVDEYANWRIAKRFWSEYHFSQFSTAAGMPSTIKPIKNFGTTMSNTTASISQSILTVNTTTTRSSEQPIQDLSRIVDDPKALTPDKMMLFEQSLDVAKATLINLQMQAGVQTSSMPQPEPQP